MRIFFEIGIPLGSPGIISALVLGFLENWNLLEQPMAFLKTKEKWPLSLYLPNITMDQAGAAFARFPCWRCFRLYWCFWPGRTIWNRGLYPLR